MAYQVKCEQCGKEIIVTPSRFKSRKMFFCNKKCEGNFRRQSCTTKIRCCCKICGKELFFKKSRYDRNIYKENITCSFKCGGILKKSIYSGRNNPNCKYKTLDDNFFEDINNEEKAYILGWIASDGSISENGTITIEIKNIDKEILNKMRDIICKDLPVVDDKPQFGDHSSLSFHSKKIVKDICFWLDIKPGKKSASVNMPNINKNLKWHFIRGYFDGDGSIRNIDKKRSLDCGISTTSILMKKNILKVANTGKIYNGSIYWSGTISLNFLDNMYKNATIYLKRKYDMYKRWKEYFSVKV